MMNEIYNKSANSTPTEYFSLLPVVDPSIGCRLCYEEDCSNHGRCTNAETSYNCTCDPGFTGEDCRTDIDDCEDNLCENNSTCIDGIAKFTCECQIGYEGTLCEQQIDECHSNPCRNGGTCIDLLANYSCNCPDEYVGHQCEAKRLVTCENKPCFNGSTCVDTVNMKTGNNFTCNCAKGMVGALCDTPFCVEEPCKYGYCNTSAEPFCHCKRGYEGKFCEINIDDCILPTGDSPCQNGGLCIDQVDTYTCDCTSTGRFYCNFIFFKY